MSIGRVPGATGIQPSIVDAKGDLIVATAADSVSRLAVGTNGQVLKADSSTATGLAWSVDSGKVLQVVEASTTSTLSTTSTSYADITGVTASITPSSASNKVLVMVNFPHTFNSVNSSGTAYGLIQLLRASTQINLSNIGWFLVSGTTGVGDGYQASSFMNLDSPSTTSSVTYKCQYKSANGATFYANYNPAKISIILMEIAV